MDDQDLIDEIISLKSQIVTLQQQVDAYKRQLDFKTEMLEQTTQSLLQEPSIITRKITPRFVEYKARFAFYRKHKTEVDAANWREAKQKTDAMFAKLSQEDKNVYIEAAFSG